MSQQNAESATKELILESLRKALFPFAKLLIHLGCSYKDFAAVAKLSFLDAATEHLARNASVSRNRLSEFSGVSKREISSLMENPHDRASLKERRSFAPEVLNELSTNPQYYKPNGESAVFPIQGSGISLRSAIDRVDSTATTASIIQELLASGSIEILDEDKVRLKRRVTIHTGFSTAAIYHFERTMYTIGSTLVSNMTARPDDSKLLEQASYTYGLKPLSLPKFLLLTRSSSESFIELVDEWISSNEDMAQKVRGSFVTGVGVYAFHVVDNPSRFDELEH